MTGTVKMKNVVKNEIRLATQRMSGESRFATNYQSPDCDDAIGIT